MHKIIKDMSNDEYHSSDAISSSDVKAVVTKSVWHWHNAIHTETPAMALGTAVHDICLEGGMNTMRGPNRRGTNAWKEAEEAAISTGAKLLPEKEYDKANDIAEAILQDEVCAKQLEKKGSLKEHSLFAECKHTGLQLRCRPDCYDPKLGVMSDIKTTVDASPKGFNRQCYLYRYDVQACFYKYVAELCGWKVNYFAFLAVENTAPYAAHMHNMSLEAFERAEVDMIYALEKIAEAKAKDEYATHWPRFSMIHPPAWMETE